MKIMYNPATCNHYGVCCEEAPELFSFAEDGSLVIQSFEIPPDLEDKARDACMMCPTQSIQVDQE
jgi:ferredoxin